jgi:hypothetical protein
VQIAPAALSTWSVRRGRGGQRDDHGPQPRQGTPGSRRLALGVGLRQARTVDIARIMKTAGYDFLFIDMEHNSMSARGG